MRLRSIVMIIATLLLFSFARANDINISTIDKNGLTLFYLQAGAFSLEKDAIKRQQQLSSLVKLPIEIKKLADKSLFLVQIGPISDYTSARALKETLSQTSSTPALPVDNTSSIPSADLNPLTKNQDRNQTLPSDSKLWNLRNADIRAVIGEISRVTGKNFVIDPRVQGKISIVSTKPMANHELYQVFLSVLQVSGYAAIPTGNIIKIIPVIDAKSLAPDAVNELKIPRGDDMMVSVVPVHYVSSEQLVPVLRPLMPQWSNVSAYAPSNMLILSGRANNIRRLTQIIQQVDSSTSNGIDIVHLRQALAMDVANTLKELVKSQPGQGNRSQITIAPDDKTNSILVSGTKTDRIRIRLLLMKLDRSYTDGSNSNTQVVYLHFLRAEDLVPILAGIAQANFSGNVGTTIGTITRPVLDSTNPASSLTNSSSSGSGTGVGANAAAAPATPPKSSEANANTTSANTQNEGTTKPTIQIIAEPNTNSIIINAPSAIIRILRKVIAQLDIKPAQLLIEAMVAEIDQNAVDDLGIEWGSNQQTGLASSFKAGFAIINSKTQIKDFQAQVYALASEQRANILSTPSVVVLDNRQAKILVGKQVSIASTTYPNNAGGTTTASPYTTFDRVNVALHLYVRPQITQGQGIQMQIDQGNDTLDPSSVTNTVANTVNPTFNISSIVTSVNVDSGDTVVLGGLTQDGLSNTDDEIPILSGIPGVGRFFQRNIRGRQKKVLMVFIKPIILRSEMDSVLASGTKYDDTRQLQLEWVRSQELYAADDSETALPPLVVAELPIPFTAPLTLAQAAK